jgi:hypothetical protein
MSGIAPKQNAFKFEIAPHKQKSIVKVLLAGRLGPLANEALCISTMVNPGLRGKKSKGVVIPFLIQT